MVDRALYARDEEGIGDKQLLGPTAIWHVVHGQANRSWRVLDR